MIKDLFTEKDGVSYCPVRSAFIIGLILYFSFTIHDIITIKDFSFMTYAKDWLSGLAEYLGFGGGAVAGKNFTEKAEEVTE